MPTREQYEANAQAMGWPELRTLWQQITIRDTPGWAPGKAFEYLVLRAFHLDGAEVRWPYPVSLYGQDEVIEEIDGSVRASGLYNLIECKNEGRDIAIAPIAKLRNQLLRRPAGTFGMVFSSHGYTEAARQLSDRSPEVRAFFLAVKLLNAPLVVIPMSKHRPFTEYLPVFHH